MPRALISFSYVATNQASPFRWSLDRSRYVLSAACIFFFVASISLDQGGGTEYSNFHIWSSNCKKVLAILGSIFSRAGPKNAIVLLSTSVWLVHWSNDTLFSLKLVLGEKIGFVDISPQVSLWSMLSRAMPRTSSKFFPGINCVTKKAAPRWTMFLPDGFGSRFFISRSDAEGSPNRIVVAAGSTPNRDIKSRVEMS